MKKVTQVETDDPVKNKFTLVIKGPVKKIVDIKPAYVRLKGYQGETLETFVRLTPSEKFNFSVLGMKLRKNRKIKASLIKPGKGEKVWKIKITAASQKAEDLYDVLTVQTNNKYKPRLRIRVYAIFLEKKEQNS